MKRFGLSNPSKELLIQRCGGGIQLLRPDQAMSAGHYNVSQMLDMPFNVYFLNTDSAVVDLNEYSAMSCGFSSTRNAVGRTVREVAKKTVAEVVIHHDQLVMQSNNMILQDEPYERAIDGELRSSIAIKFPWYDDNRNIIGVFGSSIVMGSGGTCSMAQALSLITETGLLSQSNHLNRQPVWSDPQTSEYYFTQREKDVLRCLVLGKTAKEIAKNLKISPRTVEGYLIKLKTKVGVDSKSALTEKIVYLFRNHPLAPVADPLH